MIETFLLQSIIIFLLITLIITHRRDPTTATTNYLGGISLNRALETMINAGFLPGGVAEVLRYLSLKRQRDKYPGWLNSPPHHSPVRIRNIHLHTERRNHQPLEENQPRKNSGRLPKPPTHIPSHHQQNKKGEA